MEKYQKKGIALSVYVDRGSNFETTRHQSMEYQLIPPMAGPPDLPEPWRN